MSATPSRWTGHMEQCPLWRVSAGLLKGRPWVSRALGLARWVTWMCGEGGGRNHREWRGLWSAEGSRPHLRAFQLQVI